MSDYLILEYPSIEFNKVYTQANIEDFLRENGPKNIDWYTLCDKSLNTGISGISEMFSNTKPLRMLLSIFEGFR